MRPSQITEWCHEIIRSQAAAGGFYIDATMGKGKDTLMLCHLAGKTGRVLAFDIQDEALLATQRLLEEQECLSRARLIKDGHENMDLYAGENTADVICFNFGYLPGGRHHISTSVRTSVEAIKKGLKILKKGGMMSLCIYSGGDTGFEEKEGILECLRGLSAREYTVIVNEYYNRANNPPIPVFVFKN